MKIATPFSSFFPRPNPTIPRTTLFAFDKISLRERELLVSLFIPITVCSRTLSSPSFSVPLSIWRRGSVCGAAEQRRRALFLPFHSLSLSHPTRQSSAFSRFLLHLWAGRKIINYLALGFDRVIMHRTFATLNEMLCLFSSANPFFSSPPLKAFLFLSGVKSAVGWVCVGQQVPVCSVLNVPCYAICLHHCVVAPMCLQPASGDPGDEKRPSLTFYLLICTDNAC